jgi:SPP1 family predicted phage head-tail adaptor
MPLPAGLMNQRVTIERLKPQASGRFGEQPTKATAWAEVRTVWGNVMSINAQEIVQSDRSQAFITYRVRIRTVGDLRAKDRLRWAGRVLNIQAVQLRGLRREEQEILCTEEST